MSLDVSAVFPSLCQHKFTCTCEVKMCEIVKISVCCCQVWTERINRQGAVNFITGAGGFLLAVLFGYGGFRLREKQLDFYPTLPPTCTKLTIHGVYYLGNKMKFTIKKQRFYVKLTSRGKISPELELVIRKKKYHLQIGKTIHLVRGRGFVHMIKKH